MPDRITATGWRNAKTRVLTVDQTVRQVTLDPGRYLLFGDQVEVVRFTTLSRFDELYVDDRSSACGEAVWYVHWGERAPPFSAMVVAKPRTWLLLRVTSEPPRWATRRRLAGARPRRAP